MKNEKNHTTLALYLGCGVMTPQGIGRLYTVEDCPVCGVIFDERVENYFVDFDVDDVRPILRPLSDITDPERDAVQEMVDAVGIIHDAATAAQMTMYLTSACIDVFGWIDAGLAIDKTKTHV